MLRNRENGTFGSSAQLFILEMYYWRCKGWNRRILPISFLLQLHRIVMALGIRGEDYICYADGENRKIAEKKCAAMVLCKMHVGAEIRFAVHDYYQIIS